MKKDRSLLVMNPLFMNIRQAFDYTSTTESASHQAVASSFFENNENVLSDTGLVGTVVSRKFEKVQKAEFQKLVTEGDAMVSSKTKSAHVETKTSIEETLKSSAHDSVYNADLLKSNTATIDIPLSDSNVTLNEAVDIQGMKIVKDSHSYSLQSTKKENVSENDSNKNSLWSGREDENREYSCIVNNDNVNSFDWRSLTHIHSGMSLTSAEIAATNMEHMKVQGQVIKKTMAGTSKSNSVIVMKPFKTMANFEDADQKSLGSGLLSKSTSKYSQMDEQSLLSKVTYSVKSEGNNTYLSMDDLPCPESEIELSSGSGPEYSRLSEDEPSFVVSVEHSNDDSQEISLHPSNMLECHSNSSFKEYKDEIKRVGRYGSADAYRKIIVTNVKRSVTQKPKVVIFLKRSKIFPQTQVSVKQPISTGVYTKSSYKNRQLSAKVDKGEYDLDIKELGIQKSSYSSTSFSVDDYMCVKNEIGHLSSVLERCNASAENSQTISLHDSDSSNDDTPKESHHSEYALMSNSGGHLSSQLGSSDSGDIRGDNMNNSSSFFSSKNGTLLRSEIDGIHCHHSSNKEECAYQEVPNEDVLSITKSKAIFTERKSKGRFRSLRSSCSPHYSEKRSNWQYSRLEDLHFNSRPEDETFVITSRHKKTGQKLTDPFEIFETLMPESPKKLAYHCVLLFGGRSKPNIHEFDKTCEHNAVLITSLFWRIKLSAPTIIRLGHWMSCNWDGICPISD